MTELARDGPNGTASTWGTPQLFDIGGAWQTRFLRVPIITCAVCCKRAIYLDEVLIFESRERAVTRGMV